MSSIEVRIQNEEMSDFKNGRKEGGKETRSKLTARKRTKSVELWSDPVARGGSGADAPLLAARPTAWTTSPAHNWAHHSCFPSSPPSQYPAPCHGAT